MVQKGGGSVSVSSMDGRAPGAGDAIVRLERRGQGGVNWIGLEDLDVMVQDVSGMFLFLSYVLLFYHVLLYVMIRLYHTPSKISFKQKWSQCEVLILESASKFRWVQSQTARSGPTPAM